MSRLTAGQRRKVQRAAHIAAGLAVLGYVYAPLPALAQDMVRVVLVPLLVATGVAMWQAPRLRRARKALLGSHMVRSQRLMPEPKRTANAGGDLPQTLGPTHG